MNKFHLLLLFILVSISGLTAQSVAPVEPSKAAPAWAKTSNIYEVNLRQYTEEGTLAAFAEHLPRLKEMGVDILWFMPIFPISETKRKGTLGSYYAVSDFKQVNPEFGTMDEFAELVEQIHSMGMHVILDWVPNHTGWDHVWIEQHPDFYTTDAEGNIIDPINVETGESWGWTDVADLNYDNPKMRAAMINDLLFWIKYVGIDGYRMDVAHGVPFDFWEQTVAALRKEKPDVFLLAEAEIPEQRNEELFAMNYGWAFHHLLNEITHGEKNANDVEAWYQQSLETYDKGYFMHFITNHDENSWAGTVEERMGDAYKALAVLAFTFDGMPLIYSGQEQGLNKRLEFFEKDPIEWGTFKDAEFYRNLLELKKRNQALWNGSAGARLVRIPTDQPEAVFAFTRERNGDQFTAIINLSDKPQSVTFEKGYKATDLFTGDKVKIKAGKPFDLPAWGYVAFE